MRAVDRFEAPGEIKWAIISAVPASDFLGPVYRAAYLSIVHRHNLRRCIRGPRALGGRRRIAAADTLTTAAQAIAKGEWREVPEVRRNDEVGLLAQAFTLMTARLRETLDGLRRSEAKLEEAQHVAHVGYWDRDLDTDRITWSDETYRIYGLTPQVKHDHTCRNAGADPPGGSAGPGARPRRRRSGGLSLRWSTAWSGQTASCASCTVKAI